LGSLNRQSTALGKVIEDDEPVDGDEGEQGDCKIWITPSNEMKAMQFGHNYDMSIFSVIIKGQEGQQHKILSWTIDEAALEEEQKELQNSKKEVKPMGGLLDMVVNTIVAKGEENIRDK
jgi:hypothetical protein